MGKLISISSTLHVPEGRVRVTDVLADEGVWIELIEPGDTLPQFSNHSFYLPPDQAVKLAERIEEGHVFATAGEHWRFSFNGSFASIRWLLGMKSATLTAKQADTFAKQLIAVITEKRHRRNKEESHG